MYFQFIEIYKQNKKKRQNINKTKQTEFIDFPITVDKPNVTNRSDEFFNVFN